MPWPQRSCPTLARLTSPEASPSVQSTLGETAAEGEFQEVGIWGATSEAASHCMLIWRAELERDYTIG